jgi:hypothetical protein
VAGVGGSGGGGGGARPPGRPPPPPRPNRANVACLGSTHVWAGVLLDFNLETVGVTT